MKIRAAIGLVLSAGLLALVGPMRLAADESKASPHPYVTAPAARMDETPAEARAASAGCLSCHTQTDAPSMHETAAVVLGCADCHGGDATVTAPAGLAKTDPRYGTLRDQAHVLPRYPESWRFPHTGNPQESYTLLNREAPQFIRFINPSDYRVVREACGACHLDMIQKAERSLMATGAMLWGGAAYNNGIVPAKHYILGEAYTHEGEPARILSAGNPPGTVTPEQADKGALPGLYPLPAWQTTPPADIFRVFERGGRNIGTQFPEIGLPDATGLTQRLEEPGRPDIRQSNRGPGTGLRVAIPVLNISKTRLNDPLMWFLGTNDQPGDYRSSGCAACHVVYANDRDPMHSLTYARYGRDGQTVTKDPTIDKTESGHPLRHAFTRSIPSSQCMNCHMHQPNMFVNSYYGYTMWDYEADAPSMWPKEQAYPTDAEVRKVLDRNPEGAAPRGLWASLDFLRNVFDLNPRLKDTQFADYHGHGWNFRGVFKRDRKGDLLDADGHVVANDDPEKWRLKSEGKFATVGTNPGKTVHMMDIHAEKGMQCADCHFAQDAHGNGLIVGEVANGVEIGCRDCHGSVAAYPTLRTSNVAASKTGTDLTLLRNPDGKKRFEWMEKAGRRVLVQRSIVDPSLEWDVSLVRDAVDPDSPKFNARAARAKLMSKGGQFLWGPSVSRADLGHKDSEMECFTCHT
ncbi:MAG: multiheme c-type cytochrome, partial [Alphaproteobacteria bacterium]